MKCPVIYDAETKVWSHPKKGVRTKICLGERIFERLNENDPNKIIEVNYDNGEELTSSQLKKLTITVAKNLLNLGIKKDDVVLFFSSGFNSLTTSIVYACYTIGVAICPIDLTFTDDDADFIIDLVNPTVILYDPIYRSRVESILKRINVPNLKYVLSFEHSNDGKSVHEMLYKPVNSIDDFEVPDLGDPDTVVAGLILTSGTTGRPKVVCLSHSHMGIDIDNTVSRLDSSIVEYIPTPFRWIGPILLVIMPIMRGSCRVYSERTGSPELSVDIIGKYGVTNFFAVDGFLRKTFSYAQNEGLVDNLKSLRYVITGGERVSSITYDLVKSLIPNSVFGKGYGMTEICGCATMTIFESITNVMECGSYIIEGFSLKIIDDNKKSLGPNQNGQICIKGRVPHLKYYHNDKKNAECFTDDGWYLTGDYGKFDDKHLLHVFNRCIDLIRCGEHIIIPSIIEKHLEEHNAIKCAYIVGIPDTSKGELPIVFIKLNSDISNDTKSHEDLKNDFNKFLKPVLPSDKLYPLNIFILENLPYTSCEKVDKMKLKQWARENLK